VTGRGGVDRIKPMCAKPFHVALIVGLGLCAGGCEKALFPSGMPRTPYDRYQQLHGQRRAETEENAYGGEQPALRDRLRPLGRQ